MIIDISQPLSPGIVVFPEGTYSTPENRARVIA